MKQLIEQQREEFEDLFCDREMVVKDGITQIKYKPTQDAIFDWHKQSLKQFIDELIEFEENMLPDECDCTGAKYECEHWGRHETINESIAHLKELKEQLN